MCLEIKTRKVRMDNGRPYLSFGKLLIDLRKKAGIQQADLAKLINSTQQTVSRWEMGSSRPRDKQMPLIAAALAVELSVLLSAAGYSPPSMTTTPFVQPFPVDALSPDDFERFCFYFLQQLYSSKNANIHRAGKSGHTQDGIDIEVTFPDKTTYTVQCKRVRQFGPKDVHAAVAKHTKHAEKKFLLLSRVASPQAREAIKEHSSWDIWDQEDIAREIRQGLAIDEQVRLVDIFFPGQRFALLGEAEAGPWQKPGEFFAPFMSESGAFTHKWSLIGREKEADAAVSALLDPNKRAVFLVGSGGAGKSRVLKEIIEKYQQKQPTAIIRFLSPRHEVKAKNLEDLGNSEKLLIVDDAHDETSLQLIFQHLAVSKNTKLLLAFRPYGLDFIKMQAVKFAFTEDHVTQVELKPLDLPQAKELVSQVLKEFNGPMKAAEQIARLTLDCPLATVIGAQIVAKGVIDHVELVKNEARFRDTILARFQDVIAGSIGNKGDDAAVRNLLKVLALIQPFHPDDKSVAELVVKVEGIPTHETNRLLSLLSKAGVIFKRGGKYRLSPDLLADFIIEEHCIGLGHTSTGYAEKIFAVADGAHFKNILLNLGKLDWRLTNNKSASSKLLDGIWQMLKPSQQYSDPCIEAVKSVAYYQPERALRFVEQMMAKGQYLTELPSIIKYAAYNFEQLPTACDLLWVLGRGDNRETGRNPEHAIRVLAEMCGVERNKPLGYNEAVVDFALTLLDVDGAWDHRYTPFDILKSILSADCGYTESRGTSFLIGSIPIPYSAIAPLREKVVSKALQLLASSSPQIALQAARFLGESLRYYSKSGDNNHQQAWYKAITKTLKDIEQVIRTNSLDPLVIVELTRAVSWHANFGRNTTTTPIAKRIVSLQPVSLDYRATLALIDGYGHLRERDDIQRGIDEWNKTVEFLAKELVVAYPDARQLHGFISEILAHIQANIGSGSSSPNILLGHLINVSTPFAEVVLADATAPSHAKTILFADMALAKLLSEDHSEAVAIAQRFLETDVRELHVAVASGYGRYGWGGANVEFKEVDLKLLTQVVSSKDEWVVICACQAIRAVAKQDARTAVELLKQVDFAISAKVADEMLMLFEGGDSIPFKMLTSSDINCFLEKLIEVQELDGHWTEIFLANCSEHYAQETATFFMRRVERAAKEENWHYRPCNYGPYGHIPLRFRRSSDFVPILRQVAHWMKKWGDCHLFHYRAAELFGSMFHPFDNELVGFIQDWIDIADAEDIDIISRILKESAGDIAFTNRVFVERFLEKAKTFGTVHLDKATSALYSAVSTGERSGKMGEPFPQDIRQKELAEKALNETPRYSPAYRLYEWIKQDAEQGICRSLAERELYEE